jgi:hypothetical protein
MAMNSAASQVAPNNYGSDKAGQGGGSAYAEDKPKSRQGTANRLGTAGMNVIGNTPQRAPNVNVHKNSATSSQKEDKPKIMEKEDDYG